MAQRTIFYVRTMQNKQIFLVICLLFVCACGPLPQVPVEERSVLTEREQIDKYGGQLIRFAQPGDTMHSIAFIAGLDVNKLALWNEITDTSKLKVGQRIRLTKPIGFVAPKPQPKVVVKSKAEPKIVAVDIPKSTQPATSAQANTTVSKTAPKTPGAIAPRKIISWSWPSAGKVIRRFGLANGQQGIDIQSVKGRAVLASNAGEVVYVGNSLKGYGNLIIVKHNEVFLSAYAHNDKILVKEGQRISKQQAIGAIGINNRREAALHFQIRKNGRPVDPLAYLPKKG